MLTSRLAIILAAIFFSISLHAQSGKDFTSYHETMLQVEQWFANEEFDQAIVGYQALSRDYGRLLARDAFNACQVAAMLGHPFTDSLYYYCGLAGVPEALAKHNTHISKARNLEIDHFDALYKSGYANYQSRIDPALRTEFIKRYNTEQQAKGRPEYKEVCTDNFNRIRQLAAQGNFPGEQTIGVDNNLETSYTLATLLHYPYSYRILNKELDVAIRHGQLQPLGVAYLYGFNQTRNSVLYDPSVTANPGEFAACYNLGFGKFDSNTETVDAHRKARMISSLKVHAGIERVARLYRIDYKLGY